MRGQWDERENPEGGVPEAKEVPDDTLFGDVDGFESLKLVDFVERDSIEGPVGWRVGRR